MKFLIEYWPLMVVTIAAVTLVGVAIYGFANYPTSTKLQKVREWLLYACAAAEKEFGSKTGKIKLRYVYNLFLGKFPELAKVITFDDFSGLVDEALEKFENLLESNEAVKEYVEGSN